MPTRSMAERDYLSIGEVLELLQAEYPDVTISKIRFLESQGLIDPERTPSGYRKFYGPDIDRLRLILRAQRDSALPLRVIRERLDAHVAEGARHDESGSAVVDGPAATVRAPVAGGQPAPAGVEPSSPQPAELGERPPVWVTAPGRLAARPPEPAAPAAHRGAAHPGEPGASRLEPAATGVSLTFDELATAAGLTRSQLEEVQRFGLVTGRPVGPVVYFGAEDLVIARLAARFLAHGIEPRHLKTYKHAVEREVGLFEQVVMPLVKQRNPKARAQARATVADLAELGGQLRAALLRVQVEPYT